jgi:hypothetical protein
MSRNGQLRFVFREMITRRNRAENQASLEGVNLKRPGAQAVRGGAEAQARSGTCKQASPSASAASSGDDVINQVEGGAGGYAS